MKKIIYIHIGILVLSACSHNAGSKEQDSSQIIAEPIENDRDSLSISQRQIRVITSDELKKIMQNNIFDDFYLDQTLVFDSIPEITPLPFGPPISEFGPGPLVLPEIDSPFQRSCSGNFYTKLIADSLFCLNQQFTSTYILPDIKRFKYLELLPYNDTCSCVYNIPADSLFKIQKYKKRLPDLGNMQVYYMCNDDYKREDHHHDYPEEFKKYCSDYRMMYYGYLILYNPKYREATVFLIYFHSFIDADEHCGFHIDKNYNIFLHCYGATDSEEGEDFPEIYHEELYKVNISNDGIVTVEEIYHMQNY